MRTGVAAIAEPIEPADGWVWMADHSNQIGPEKTLVVIGLRASQIPPPGVALTHQNVRVLTVEPGVSWKREDMARVDENLADRIGAPLAVVVDGAVELREGAEVLQKRREHVLILGDFKHYAANVLKRIVGDSPRFAGFMSQVGSTRSAIQQTELGHLTPPSPRPKVTFIIQQGLFRGATKQLAGELQSLATCDDSRTVANRLVEFVRQSEEKLAEGQRLPPSTEILESSFCAVQATGATAQQGGIHQSAGGIRRVVETRNPRLHPPGLRPRFRQADANLGHPKPENNSRLQTTDRLR